MAPSNSLFLLVCASIPVGCFESCAYEVGEAPEHNRPVRIQEFPFGASRELVARLGQGKGTLHPLQSGRYAFLIRSHGVKLQLELSGARGYPSTSSGAEQYAGRQSPVGVVAKAAVCIEGINVWYTAFHTMRHDLYCPDPHRV